LDFAHSSTFNFGITSEYWTNVYGAEDASEAMYYCGAEAISAIITAGQAEDAQDTDLLAAACAAYTVTYEYTDCANDGNSASAAQTVWVIDTVQPVLSYELFANMMSGASTTGAFVLVAGVALFAGLIVGRKTGARTEYTSVV
jgi:hypothetical protein